MSKPRCIDNRNSCGSVIPSACVPYTGETLSIINEDNLPCNPNVNDIFKEINGIIVDIQSAINVTEIDKDCLAECNCDATTIKSLLELIIKKLCELTATVATLQSEVDNIGLHKFTLNLDCFNNPCFNNTNNEYTLLELLTLLITEVCNLKNQP